MSIHTRCRQLSLGLALVLAPQAHASAETLDFVATQLFSLGEAIEPTSVVVRDFNGDGFLDVVTANFVTNDISLLFGNRHGGFRAARRFSVGQEPRSMTTGDFNRDGMEDVATANSASGDVSVLLGRGPGGFGFEKAIFLRIDASLYRRGRW